MERRLSAIVLGKREVGETDRIYTFYTRETGKVRAKAIGVRKPTAKLAGHLETLSLIGFTLVRNRGLGRVSGAVAEESFPYIRSDYGRLRVALDTVATFDRLTDLEHPDPELFDMLREYLSLSDGLARDGAGDGKSELLSAAFLVRALDSLGYRMEAGTCAVSGGRIGPGSRCFFSPEAGGIVTEGHEDRYALPVGANTVKLIRIFLGNGLSSTCRLRVGADDLVELSRILSVFIGRVTG